MNRYTDFKPNLDIHPVKKDIILAKNENAVKRSILNLCFTDNYERPFNPRLGSGLKRYLFDPLSKFTALQIRDRIIDTIETYEPRAKLGEVIVVPDYDNNAYEATIIFSLINNPKPITLNLILNRVR